MKKCRRVLLLAAVFLFTFAMTALAVTPVVNIDSISRESDGTITVELSAAEEYNIVEMRIAPGSHGKEGFNAASPISGGTVSGLKSGKYTVFVKDKDGNIGAYPMTTGESSSKDETVEESSDSWEEEESYEYGGSWIEYSVEANECETTAPETTAPETEPEVEQETEPETTAPETEPETRPDRDRPSSSGGSDGPGPGTPETTVAPTVPETIPAVQQQPTQTLPQTGGLLEPRMLATLFTCLLAAVGGILLYRSRKNN